MALKTITFTVGVNEIKPATIQDGGIQGDHKKTELRFDFNDELYNYLKDIASNGKLVYRFDATDGEGTVHHSDTANLTGRRVTYPLEYTVTCHGGIVQVELIISRIEEKIIENKKVEYVTNEVLHTKAAELKLTFAPYSTGDKSQPYKDLSTLAEVAKQNAEKAEAAAAEAKSAQQQTENAKTAFQNGTTYIFNGGNASGEIDANFIVDTELSDYSTNAVQNKAIKKYVDDKYPVGSIWVGGKNGSEPIDPSEIFGGEWELIDKEFASVARSDTESNGALFIKGDGIENYKIYTVYGGHTIRLRIDFRLKEALGTKENFSGAELYVGKLRLEELGITGLYNQVIDIIAAGDNANGLAIAGINLVGEVELNQVFHDMVAGNIIHINAEITNMPYDRDKNVIMLDSFCDKFYWQRKELKENDYE